MRRMTGEILNDFRRCWKQLIVTDLIYKIIAFVFLTPLVTVPLQIAVGLSRNTVLADQDILQFFLTPVGAISLIAMGALSISIVAFEITALTAILAGESEKPVQPFTGIYFAWLNKVPILNLTARITLALILVTSPFLVTAGLVYLWLLGDHDINFYLQKRPPEFKLALALGGVLLIGWALVVLRLISSWFFSLAMVVYEQVPASSALRQSRERSRGHRRNLLVWFVIWLVGTGVLSGLLTGLVVTLARGIVPGLQHSLSLLVLATGLTMLCWFIVNVIVSSHPPEPAGQVRFQTPLDAFCPA